MNFGQSVCEALNTEAEKLSAEIFFEVQKNHLREVSRVEFRDWVCSAQSYLKQQGLEAGDRVVILAENSAKWAALDLACMGLALVSVPLYLRHDLAELVYMIEDAQAKLVIVKESIPGLSPSCAISDFSELFSQGSSEEVIWKPRKADDLMTLVYTSGTSGPAKGVQINFGNADFMVEQTVSILERTLKKTSSRNGMPERVFHYLPFCFMGSRIMLWCQLSRMHAMYLSTDLNALKEELKTADPSYFLNVPLMLERVRSGVEGVIAKSNAGLRWCFEKAWEDHRREKKTWRLWMAKQFIFPKVKAKIGNNLSFLICGSAPLNEETQKWFFMLGIPVLQVYGLTESTAIITMDDVSKLRVGAVGKFIAGCEYRIQETGELWVKGPHVFTGYWNNSEATQSMLEEGWLKTGDQVTLEPSGHLRIMGRVKNLIVSETGHNINPELIEEKVCEQSNQIQQVVVLGHGKPFLTALVYSSLSEDEIEKMLENLNEDLPHYKRVRRVIKLKEALSAENGFLTANQKLKRKSIEQAFQVDVENVYAEAQRRSI